MSKEQLFNEMQTAEQLRLSIVMMQGWIEANENYVQPETYVYLQQLIDEYDEHVQNVRKTYSALLLIKHS